MDVRLGDVLLMKKPHPCGGREWTCCGSAWISASAAAPAAGG